MVTVEAVQQLIEPIHKELQSLRVEMGRLGKAAVLTETLIPIITRVKALEDQHTEHILPIITRVKTLEDQSAARTAREKDFKGVFNTKELKLEPYNGSRAQYQNFAWVIKQFIRKDSPHLAAALDNAELETKEIKQEFITEKGITEAEDQGLKWLLINFTSGDARDLLRSRDEHNAAELWRLLRKEAEPRGGEQEARSLAFLMRPPRAKDMKTLIKTIREWDRILKEEKRRANPNEIVLPDRLAAVAMQEMMPMRLKEEVGLKPMGFRESHKDLRGYLEDMIYKSQLEGNGMDSIAQLEEEPEEELLPISYENPETGQLEVHYVGRKDVQRFQKRPAGRQPNLRPPGTNQTRGAHEGGQREGDGGRKPGIRDSNGKVQCFRCKAIGHIRPECTAKTRVDNGLPCKGAGKGGLNNVEQSVEEHNLEVEDIEMNVLEEGGADDEHYRCSECGIGVDYPEEPVPAEGEDAEEVDEWKEWALTQEPDPLYGAGDPWHGRAPGKGRGSIETSVAVNDEMPPPSDFVGALQKFIQDAAVKEHGEVEQETPARLFQASARPSAPRPLSLSGSAQCLPRLSPPALLSAPAISARHAAAPGVGMRPTCGSSATSSGSPYGYGW